MLPARTRSRPRCECLGNSICGLGGASKRATERGKSECSVIWEVPLGLNKVLDNEKPLKSFKQGGKWIISGSGCLSLRPCTGKALKELDQWWNISKEVMEYSGRR